MNQNDADACILGGLFGLAMAPLAGMAISVSIIAGGWWAVTFIGLIVALIACLGGIAYKVTH